MAGRGTYLFTGCLGGVGLRMLAYCCSQGATHLLLMDRDKGRRRSMQWIKTHSLLADFFPDVKLQVCNSRYSLK
jgi:hypothetical protein